MIRIVFRKSPSQYYKDAVSLAETANMHRIHSDDGRERHVCEFKPERNLSAWKLLQIIRNWKGTEVYLRGQEIAVNGTTHRMLACYLSCPADPELRKRYCSDCHIRTDPYPLPCRWLSGSYCQNITFRHWFNWFGHFQSPTRYILNRRKIRAAFETSMATYSLELCPWFKAEAVTALLVDLPAALETDDGSPWIIHRDPSYGVQIETR